MDLKAYLKSLPDDKAREAFALSCETSVGHLRNVGYGQKPCSAKLAALIEVMSGGVVTRKSLLPNDWRVIWPELVQAPAASDRRRGDRRHGDRREGAQ